MQRNLFKALIGLVICTMVFSFAPASSALAVGGNWYVRQDGSDTVCDGSVNLAYNDPAHVGNACAFATIQKAVTTAAAGDTVHVGPGPFTLPALTITKNVTLVGDGRDSTALKPNANVAADGWIHVNPGVTFNMSGFGLDGTGFNVERAVQSLGNSTIQNNRFQNIAAPGYLGIAVAVYNSSTVSNNSFNNIGRVGILISTNSSTSGTNTSIAANNIYVGKGTGDHLDYGIEVGAGSHAAVTGNVVTGNSGIAASDGSTSAGIYVESYFAPDTNATLTSNTMTNNYDGIMVGYLDTDTSTVVASFNRMYMNSNSGLSVVGTVAHVTAENNWWGCNPGPSSPVCDQVKGTADYTPWLVLTGGPAKVVRPLGTVAVTANLVMNSDGVDTSSMGTVLDGTNATFLPPAQGGTVDPTTGGSVKGVFTTNFTAPNVADGTVLQVCTGVDNYTQCSNVTVLSIVAVADSYATSKNATLNVSAPGVLANDTAAANAVLTAVLNTTTTHGTLNLAADGSFSYVPEAGFVGTDTFTYHANDGTSNSNVVTVTITVGNVDITYLPMIFK